MVPVGVLGLLLCVQLCAGERQGGGQPGAGGQLWGTEELRLVGGGGRCAGRVEVKHNGKWGSVCVYDFDWDARWATVVCRQLGCGRVAKASSYTPFGQGTGQIWLQPFFCRGTEAKLQDCPHFGWGKHFCGHKLDVGVTCTGELVGGDWSCRDTCPGCPWAGLMPCRCPGADAVELRLAAGEGPCSGRVEVKLQGQWGSVGDENWDMDNAEVVCQHLGCGSAAPPAAGGGGELVRWAAGGCCKPRGLGDASTVSGCHSLMPSRCPTGSRRVRLAGGPGRCAGRVEVYINGTWGTVCQETWDMLDAAVVCRQLGCGTALAAPSSARFGPGTGPLWLDAGGCVGTEASLWDCPGHLEVLYNGTWGRVCSNGTSPATAATVCWQLGCGNRGSLAAVPTQNPAPAWLAWVGCEEGARSLWQCRSAPWHLQACSPGRDTYITCDRDSDSTSGMPTPSPGSRCADGATCTGSSTHADSPPVPG
uniref:SRCR domain-containing protein n=1 Tax=Athene cunicularia TaxID=194338 RepID=A0A663LZU1_ATHCN